MSENNELDKIMNELMASLSEDTRDAMMRRINAERLIKLATESLVDQHEAENIRVIPDNRILAQEAADYLIQIDDYDVRLILLDAPDGKIAITQDLLNEWSALMESNSKTIELIVVWANEELSSIPFTMRGLKSALDSPEQIKKMPEIAKPFEQVISEVIHHQTKGWKIPKFDSSQPSTSRRDLYSIFSEKIIRAIDIEANRRYRTEERVKAAQKFPYEQEKRAILSILQEALDGISATDLQKRLTNLPRRGEQ